jgi:hypothetical protein
LVNFDPKSKVRVVQGKVAHEIRRRSASEISTDAIINLDVIPGVKSKHPVYSPYLPTQGLCVLGEVVK